MSGPPSAWQERWGVPTPVPIDADHDKDSAAQMRLGEHLATFEVRTGLSAIALLLAILGTFISLLCGAVAVFAPINPKVNPIVARPMLFAPPAALLAGSIYLAFAVVRRIGVRVFLHKEGLAITRGERVSSLTWDEIDVVWRKVKTLKLTPTDFIVCALLGSKCVYTIQASNSERFVFDSYLRGVESLGGAIESATITRLLTAARKVYEIEGTVEFGKISVGRKGLTKGNNTVPWSEVGQVSVGSGTVLVNEPNGGRTLLAVGMRSVPNLHVFQALVAKILGPQVPT
jgi:hypothetical protein